VEPESRLPEASHMKYTVVVNGERRTVDVPERMPLLWVLRDAMGLKGTKYGCGVAQCGACTVLVDGQPTRSCITPISSIGARAVSTIESLPQDASHPLQRAWLELDVPQCGYCQAGQLMAASALLKATPNPTDDQIDTAMSGNVCRCGTYLRIRDAIKAAASAGRRG
jgi:isoquinoline 1-oxidoreductase subunit alpha